MFFYIYFFSLQMYEHFSNYATFTPKKCKKMCKYICYHVFLMAKKALNQRIKTRLSHNNKITTTRPQLNNIPQFEDFY